MLSLRLMASAPFISPRTNATPASKDAIFTGGFSRRNLFLGTIRVSNHQKKVVLTRFDSFPSGGVGLDEDDLTSANQKMEKLETSLNKMSKWVVGGLFAITIILKHDAVTIWAAMGALLNTFFSTTLKKILNQERPISAFRSDPGMPSSHSQFIFYAVIFSIYLVKEVIGVNVSSVAVGAIIFICGAYLSWLRVSQQLHTINQVIVGAALGSTCSLSWLWIWHLFVSRAFDSSIAARAILLIAAAAYYAVLLFYATQHWLQQKK